MINRKYFPGEHFLITGQLMAKQQINRVHHFFSVKGVWKMEMTDSSAKMFLEILAKAPIDHAKVKIIAFQLDHASNMDSRFAREVDSLARTPAYQPVFGDNIRTIDFTGSFTDKDYYHLDVHLTPPGHKKVAEKIGEVINNWSAGR
jgi:hypothetical protein